MRYVVERIDELPAGWLGKPHAMARGAALATGEWLLFTDADVVFAEDALARALAWLERDGGDHLLVVPTVVARSAGEAMMLPFLHILSIWGPRLWRVADPGSRDAVGVGAFNLMRRATYDAVGGWERLRMEVIEDVRMGYLIKQAGFRSRVVTGRNLVRIRWAHGAWGVVTNLAKNVFAAFRFRIGLLIAGAVATAVMCLLPFAGLVLGVGMGSRVAMAESDVGRGVDSTLLALSAVCRSERRGNVAVAAGVSGGGSGFRLCDGAIDGADAGARRRGVARDVLPAA